MLLTIDYKTHSINFVGLKNNADDLRHLDGDSGSSLIESETGIAIATLTHSDYLTFFKKGSPLVKFYSEEVISKPASQARTNNFLRGVLQHGRIVKNKNVGDQKYIVFQANERISFSPLMTPLYLHYDFIMQFIEGTSPAVLKEDAEVIKGLLTN